LTIFTLLCLFTYLGDVPTQTSILDYGQGGDKLPTFIGSGPNPEFFDQELDFLNYTETDFHLTFELRAQRQKARTHRAGTIENLRIYNPNSHNIDVVIGATDGIQFQNFLVRVESHFVVDLNIEALAGYDILDMVCMMPFEAELQYFANADGKKLRNTAMRSEKPTTNRALGNVGSHHPANKTGSMKTCPTPAYPLDLTSDELNCSPDPSLDSCQNNTVTPPTDLFDYSFSCCPANQFCTENDIVRWVQLDTNGPIVRVVRRFDSYVSTTGSQIKDCSGSYVIPTWDSSKYELDLYWPLNGGSPTLTGIGGGNVASNFHYPCLQKTYVVEDSQGRKFNVKGENGFGNADDVLLGEAWGYHLTGQILCTTSNDCTSGSQNLVEWTYKTIASARIEDQSLNWGNVNVGSSAAMNLTITTYHQPYSGTITLSGDADFSFSSGSSIPINMTANDTINIPVTFAPASTGNKFAIATIPGVGEAYFSGKGVAPNTPDPSPFSSSPTSYNFGYQALNHSESIAFQVTNNETQTISANVTMSGSNTFSLLQGEGTHTFTQGQTKTFTVQYTPTAQGTYQGVLEFSVSGYEDYQINVSGNTTAGGTPELAVGTVILSKSSVSPGETVNVSYTVTNNGQDVARYWRDQIHLSSNGSLVGATQLWESNSYNFDFNPNAVMSQTVTVTIPANTQAGSYQIIVFTDARDIYAENNENDNTGSASLPVVPPN